MIIKVQRDWQLIKADLKTALESYKGTVKDLSSAANIDYFSARRYLISPPENQTKSAMILCTYFSIEIFMENKELQIILNAVEETWDGTTDHAQSLADLLRWSKSLHGSKKNQIK
jgi:hypothetical protein